MKKLLLLTAMLCFVLSTMAIPARRAPKTVKQSDGTELVVYLTGDESFHYYATADGLPLVREANGFWGFPGGWIDANQTVASNVVKELREEAGLLVEPIRVLALLDRNRRHSPVFPYNVCKVFVQCRVLGGEFTENSETIESGYFSLDNLPPLDAGKCSIEEVEMCLAVAADCNAQPIFE